MAEKRLQVGDPVSFLMGGTNIEALIVEDRGPLGFGGRRLYGVLMRSLPDEWISFQMPEDEIAPGPARWPFLRGAANRVVRSWRYGPVSPMGDGPAYEALGRAVFDACLGIAKNVRSEISLAAKDLGFAAGSLSRQDGSTEAQAKVLALQVRLHAEEHGIGGLHSEIEEALRAAATAERDRLLEGARERGCAEVEREIVSPDRDRFPLLAFLAETSIESQSAQPERKSVRPAAHRLAGARSRATRKA